MSQIASVRKSSGKKLIKYSLWKKEWFDSAGHRTQDLSIKKVIRLLCFLPYRIVMIFNSKSHFFIKEVISTLFCLM